MARFHDRIPEFHPLSRAEWRVWLTAHHATAEGVWFVYYKKETGKPRMEYGEGVEEALCFGWVDSTANTVDSERAKLMYTPRKPGSGWSKPNKERIERLLAAGLMMPAGLAKLEAAQQDGSWTKLDAAEALIMPDELAAALVAAGTLAQVNFERFSMSVKKTLYFHVGSAKQAETRLKRATKVAEAALEGRNPMEWPAAQKAPPKP